MADLTNLIEQYCNAKKIHHFEGDSGLEKFEGILGAIGYKATGFRFGTLIESFLSDNPGAVSTLLEWIGEQNVEEWAESLKEEMTNDGITVKEDDEEDEE